MNLYLAFIPLVAILLFLTLRTPSKAKAQDERPDFFTKAAESMNDVKDSVLFDSATQGFDDGEYTYEVVGESYQRDHLTALIRAQKAFETGQILSIAVLEMEPTNPFDSTAVKVVVEGTQVGYIPKFDSPAVTEMIKKSGKKVYEVPVRIGWDTNSPSPLIGVRLALTLP
jgi:uncharacterized protein with FMN-binding domain